MIHLPDKNDKDWIELYEYVKKDILNYDDNQKLNRNMVLRLVGLSEGKLMANKKQKSSAKYSFLVVLLTFKYCRLDIIKATQTKEFNGDWHKFLYITKIVENNLNEVYTRYMNNKTTQEKLKSIEVNLNNKANYQRKTTENKYSKQQKYW